MHVFNREIHPDGLPPSYTIILLFRLLPDTPNEAFDIWQISDKNNNPEVGVTINRKSPVQMFCFCFFSLSFIQVSSTNVHFHK